MRTVNTFNLKIKQEAARLRQEADWAQLEGDVEREERLRFQARAKTSFYYALENKRKKQLDKLITALEQPTLFEPE